MCAGSLWWSGKGVVRETAWTRPEAREHHSEHPHCFEDSQDCWVLKSMDLTRTQWL